jgi:phosphoribosyl-AMP cyclohydrolase
MPRPDPGEIESGTTFSPRFDPQGLLPVVVTDAASGEVLMLAWMNAEALHRTLASGEAHYWSRSRNALWRKGETSGHVQKVVEIRTDCDQDSIWLKVRVAGRGASCHAGYRSCFYRSLVPQEGAARAALHLHEDMKVFDPAEVYGAGS